MIEILSVLAIIGVLSVSGITAYKYGMIKYQANQIINEINYISNDIGIQMKKVNTSISLDAPYGNAGEDDGHHGLSVKI